MVHPSMEGVSAQLEIGDEQIERDQVQVDRISRFRGEIQGSPHKHEDNQNAVKDQQTLHPI